MILESLQRGRRQLTLETETLVAAILESSFYHKDTGADKNHFGVFPLAY